jgi:UDP-2,3-diacylglucosamine hydrolase
MKPLVLVADAHLTRDDPEVEIFIAFLADVGSRCGTLAILGDLFNIWLGDEKFQLPHHAKVFDALSDLRRGGVRLVYVEGNRDFHVRRGPTRHLFDEVAEDFLIESHGGWKIWLTHGDAVNPEDRRYRAWRQFSKSAPVWGAFRLLPGGAGVRLAEWLERRLSGTNVEHKSRFPEEHCRAYARRILDGGCHALVMGHFHEELQIPCGERGGRSAGVYVLPAWRHGHRYLVFDGEGPPRFAGFEGGEA